MKKIVSLLLGLLILPLSVSAKSAFWSDYFTEEEPILKYNQTCAGSKKDNTWSDKTRSYTVTVKPPCHEITSDTFNKELISENLVFENTLDLTAKLSKENVVKVEIKDYDFSEEKKYFEDYKKAYEENPINESKTWWQYSGFSSEPQTWYEAYGYASEPKNAHEVIIHGVDLGKTKITLSATGKEDIAINYTIQNTLYNHTYKQGLIDVLNDFETYKDVFPLNEAYEGVFAKHHMVYEVEDDEDLSDIINTLKGKDISIQFDIYKNNEYQEFFALNGKDITETVNKGFTYNYDISLEKSAKDAEIKKLLDTPTALYIDFTYHGKLPATYETKVYVFDLVKKYLNDCDESDTKCLVELDNKVINYLKDGVFTLLYYNEETNKMEVINDQLKSTEDGYVNLSFDHFSSYVLTINENYAIMEPEAIIPTVNEENPQTNDNINVMVSILFIAVFVSGIAIKSIMKNQN